MASSGYGQNTTLSETGDSKTTRGDSLGRASSTRSSSGRISTSLSGRFRLQLPEGGKCENVAVAEDVGGQASGTGSGHLTINIPVSLDNLSEAGDVSNQLRWSASLRASSRESQRGSGRIHADPGAVLPVSEDVIDPSKLNAPSPIAIDAALLKQHEVKKEPPSAFDFAYLIHLATFGILGVLTRYLLQKLFGPSVAGLTSNGTILYLDLPSNMVGSFFMGWLGLVFKDSISEFSDELAIGLSTGYLGSLTTFSGWNQKMLELSVNGHWLFAVLGFLFGLLCAFGSFVFGVDTAKAFRWLLRRRAGNGKSVNGKANSHKHHMLILLVLLLTWAGLWTTSGILEKKEFKEGGGGAQLWLACFVGPFGVWIRWWLSRLNGRGLGSSGWWKWIPFGTLAANVSAACVMAALATVKKAVNTKDCDTVATGIQLGLLGCLSTVSTFMAEFYKLKSNDSHAWRAYAYAALTIVISFGLGILMYSVPVWTKGYH